MMDDVTRLMLCFAALDLSDAELRKLVQAMRSMPVDEIVARANVLRRTDPLSMDVDQFAPTGKRMHSGGHDGSVGDRVERLLKYEAGLSTAEAVKLLSHKLQAFGFITDDHIPPLSRKALRDWVARIARTMPEKDILRVATILRNELVHSPATDWALRHADDT